MCVRAPDLMIGAAQSRDAPVMPMLVWIGRVNNVTGVANWAGNQRWSPQGVAEPRDENQVVDVVRRAAEERVRLKVIGGAHSWSDAAVTALSRLIRDEQLRVDFPAEVRFGPAETAWMSPSHGRVSVHIGAYMAQGSDRERYFAGFERAMLDLGGRPHPGKEHGLVPADLLTRFDKGTSFRDLAFDVDPHGMFANPFLDRWLGTRT